MSQEPTPQFELLEIVEVDGSPCTIHSCSQTYAGKVHYGVIDRESGECWDLPEEELQHATILDEAEATRELRH